MGASATRLFVWRYGRFRLGRTGGRRGGGLARQVAMYICHVMLGMPQSTVGRLMSRERSSVGHACKVIEDLRDDPAVDAHLSDVECIARGFYGNYDG